MPAFALFAAYALQRVKDKPARYDLLLPATACFLLSGVWFYLRLHPTKLDLPDWAATFPAWPALAFALVGAALLFAGRTALATRLRVLALSMLALLTVAYLSVIPCSRPTSIRDRWRSTWRPCVSAQYSHRVLASTTRNSISLAG